MRNFQSIATDFSWRCTKTQPRPNACRSARQPGANLHGFLATNRHGAGLRAAWLGYMPGFRTGHRHLSGVAGLAVPGRNRRGHLNQGIAGLFSARALKDHMTPRQAMHMKPQIIRSSGFQAEQIVVGIGFSCQGLPAVAKIVPPHIRFWCLFSHQPVNVEQSPKKVNRKQLKLRILLSRPCRSVNNSRL